MSEVYDLAVIGAGPAGAAAALACRRQHPAAQVLMLDAETFPRHKVCGDAISGYALDLLDALGVGRPPMATGRCTACTFAHRTACTRPGTTDAGRVLLAGDAAGLVNPFTGEGIHYALLSGSLAGRAALTGADPGRVYRDSLGRRLRWHIAQTAVLARCGRSPRFVDSAITAARRRHVFDAIVVLGLGDKVAGAGVLAALAGQYSASLVNGLTTALGARAPSRSMPSPANLRGPSRRWTC